MLFNRQQKNNLMSFFPKLELSYIKNIHKKVHSDLYLIIPKGNKFFAWFKCWNNKNICILLQVDSRNKTISDIFVLSCVFDKSLCTGKGTILYGTLIKDNCNFFTIEDIFYYKNKNINYYDLKSRYKYLEHMLKNDIKNIAYKKNDIIFSLPITSNNYNNLIKIAENVSYPIYCIQMRKLHKKAPYLNYRVKLNVNISYIFQVRTCIQEDLYELWIKDNNNKLVKHNYAYIPDCKTSVFMNSLFRNIRENSNLDLLEESDDEEEFENIDLDKFVYLDKKINMKCKYVPKMKLWKPIEVVSDEISQRKNIVVAEKK